MTQSDTQNADAPPRSEATPAPIESAATPLIEPQNSRADALVEDDLLVEDVSIDGMCGVY